MATRTTEYLAYIDADSGGTGAAELGKKAAEDFLAQRSTWGKLRDKLSLPGRLAALGVATVALMGSAACVGQDTQTAEQDLKGKETSGILSGDTACTLEVQPGDNLFVISRDLANGNPASQEVIFRSLRKRYGEGVLRAGSEISLTENICADNQDVTEPIPTKDGEEPAFVREG